MRIHFYPMMVGICIFLLAVIKTVICEDSYWFNPWFNVKSVTRFENLETFYLDMLEKYTVSEVLKGRSSHKHRLSSSKALFYPNSFCATLLDTQYFRTKLEVFVDLKALSTIEELQKYQRNILHNYYHIESSRKKKKRAHRYQYTHIYSQQNVSVGKKQVSDAVFLCLARDIQSKTIKPYFVTRPHILMKFDVNYVVFFLFAYNLNEELVVQALIEYAAVDSVDWREPTKALQIRKVYLEFHRPEDKLSDAERSRDTNPICKLSNDEKLRLCASVMSTRIYRNIVTFWPAIYNVEPTCQWRRIYLPEIEHKYMGSNSKDVKPIYKEWMIGCKTRIAGIVERQMIFYLSISKQSTTSVFVYAAIKAERDKMFLIGGSRFITVLYGS